MSCLSCFGGGATETRSTKFSEDARAVQPSTTQSPPAPAANAAAASAPSNAVASHARASSPNAATETTSHPGEGAGSADQPADKSAGDKRPTWDPHSEIARVVNNLSGQNNNIVLLEPIGQGGFATVYRGRWRNLEVAIKTVLFSEESSGSTDKAKRHSANPQQRAIMEAAVCTSVTHPNVVTTYHYDITPISSAPEVKGVSKGSTDWKLYLVQEYCDASLQDALRNKLLHNAETRVPDMDLVLSVLMDIARGLVYIHGKNIIHGDLTPGNVLLKQDTSNPIGVVGKITDFGLCTTIDPNATHISNITNGTPYYVAPEVVACGILTKNSDVYSFGVLMWELYRCMPPWVKTETGYSQNKRFRRFPADSPRVYVAMCARCLDKNPKSRPSFPEIFSELQAMHAAYLLGYDSLEQRAAGDSPAASQPTPSASSATAKAEPALASVKVAAAEAEDDGDSAATGSPIVQQMAPRSRFNASIRDQLNSRSPNPPPRSQNFVSYFNSKAQLVQGPGGAGERPEAPGTPKDVAGINVRVK